MAEFDDYDVGYGKPPKETKFMKGRSGNPRGRPKGSRNLATSFVEVSREQITVTEGGRRRTMTKGDAIIHQVTNKAASGDVRAVREYFQIYKMFQTTESTEEITPGLSDRDNELMKNFLKRMDRMGKKKSDETGVPGLFCTRSRERDCTKRSGTWRRERSIQPSRS